MRSIYQHIALPLACFCLILAAASAMSSCSTLTEDNSNCPKGLYLRFFYTYHTGEPGCRFSRQVNNLDIFVYDAADGALVLHKRMAASELDADNGTKLSLPKGDYRIITWGNYDEQAHLIAMHDNFSQMQLRLKTISNNFRQHGSLFYGDVTVGVEHLSRVNADVYMTKDTNDVHVIIEDVEGRVLDASLFTVAMSGLNGIYNYDNSLASEAQGLPLNYIPSYFSDTQDQLWAQADFTVYRLFCDESDGVHLCITANDRPMFPLHDLCLSREILRTIEGIETDRDLDCEDDYTLVYKVRYDGGAWDLVSIFINGWEVVLQREDI